MCTSTLLRKSLVTQEPSLSHHYKHPSLGVKKDSEKGGEEGILWPRGKNWTRSSSSTQPRTEKHQLLFSHCGSVSRVFIVSGNKVRSWHLME